MVLDGERFLVVGFPARQMTMSKRHAYILLGLLITLLLHGCISTHDVIIENQSHLEISFSFGLRYVDGDFKYIVKAGETKKIKNIFPDIPNMRDVLFPITGRNNKIVVFLKTISWNELKEQDWKMTIPPEDVKVENQLVNDYVNEIVTRLGWDIQEKYAMLYYIGELQIDQEIENLYKNRHLKGEILDAYEEFLNGKISWENFLRDFYWYGGDLDYKSYKIRSSTPKK